MQELIAKSDKQLASALKLVYAEKVEYKVEVRESDKRKIYYAIIIEASTEKFTEIEKSYRLITV